MAEGTASNRIVVDAHTRNLVVVRRFLREAIARSALPARDANKVVLAVDEAIANSIRHGNAGRDSGRVEVIVEAGADRFTVHVRDAGRMYDVAGKLESAAGMDLRAHIAAGNRHGLGLFILRRVMDEVRYVVRKGMNNELTLVKYIAAGHTRSDIERV